MGASAIEDINLKIEVCEHPIFVVGAPRSGTSMLQWALRQHPQLWGSEESDFLDPLIDALGDSWSFGRIREDFHWLYKQNVTHEEFLRHAGYGINSLYTNRSNGLRWVETTPRYTLKLESLATMFPGAVFLFLVRDGRQVVDSLRKFVYPQKHSKACRTWRLHTEAGINFANSPLGGRLLQIRFERLIADTAAEIGRIYDFLGLPPSLDSIDFIAKNTPINSSFPGESSVQKLDPRWLSWTASERRTFNRIAGALLIELEFEPDDSWQVAREKYPS